MNSSTFSAVFPVLSRPVALSAGGAQPAPRLRSVALVVATAVVLGGCAYKRVTPPAPVVDRSSAALPSPAPQPVPAPEIALETPKPLPLGGDNAGKPGYFTVRPGDTLIRIALEVGQNWRDLVRWNGLENPNRIEVGQVLRIVPPVLVSPPVGVAAATAAPAALATPGVTTAAVNEPALTAKPLPSSAQQAAALPPAKPAAAPGGEDEVAFIWPAVGALVASFDEQKNKGLGIGGKAGDPVLAAADGRVVYAGSGLRGYGNLIILKHNNTYLTAYAHNQSLLVKEDQDVKQGQKIAEMGSSDADRVKLHFEVRRQGKPVDPARYLPAR